MVASVETENVKVLLLRQQDFEQVFTMRHGFECGAA